MPFADSAAAVDSLLFLDGQSAPLSVETNARFINWSIWTSHVLASTANRHGANADLLRNCSV